METLRGGDEEQGPRLPPRPAAAPAADDTPDDRGRGRLSTIAQNELKQRNRTVDVEHLRDIVEKQVRTVRRTQLAPPPCSVSSYCIF